MDWLFGGFLLAPFCLVSTCGIPLLILIVVLIVRWSKTSSTGSESQWTGPRTQSEELEMLDPETFGRTRSMREFARNERLRKEEERWRKEGR